MSYPLSSDVTAGQPTAYQHYNNLRSDALRLGNPTADSCNLGEIFTHYSQNLAIEYLATNRLRVPATSAAPVGLVIGGAPVVATLNVDLPVGATPSGPAAIYYIFAVRSPGSTTFTLDINTSAAETSTRRLIGRCYWNGANLDARTIILEPGRQLEALLPLALPFVCQGRLTLATGVPVPNADITGAGTVYFTPYKGSKIALYTPAGWKLLSFSELSVSMVGRMPDRNHDVFIFDTNAGLSLEVVPWSSNTVRATALVLQDGIYVKDGALDHRYLGTVRTTSTNSQVEDSVLRRFVWNYYNRVHRSLYVSDAIDSWAYTVTSWRPYNNYEANRVEVVNGLDEEPVHLVFHSMSTGGVRQVGICLDSTISTPYTNNSCSNMPRSNAGLLQLSAEFFGQVGVGYHYLQLMEFGGASVTFFGDDGNIRSAGIGHVMA